MRRPEPDNPAQPVVLLHGLWMPGLEMSLLQQRLARRCFRGRRFAYSTFHEDLPTILKALAECVAALGPGPVHYVAHSLGGLVLRHLFAAHPELPPGRAVTLGTPHGGSRIAHLLDQVPPTRWLLGSSREMGLLGDAPAWPEGRELGVIAGTMSLGVGWFVPGFGRPNDGTVTVAETRCPEMSDFLKLPVSHTGLVLSERVAEQAVGFLTRGRFQHAGS